MYLISACLNGQAVRYDGGSCLAPQLQQLFQSGQAIALCPEMLGGLPCPRLPAEIYGGSAADVLNGAAAVIDSSGKDVSEAFIRGAQKTLLFAQQHRVHTAILKENSPSCGRRFIYDGTFQGQKTAGAGITAALLMQHGIEVISEQDFLQRSLNAPSAQYDLQFPLQAHPAR